MLHKKKVLHVILSFIQLLFQFKCLLDILLVFFISLYMQQHIFYSFLQPNFFSQKVDLRYELLFMNIFFSSYNLRESTMELCYNLIRSLPSLTMLLKTINLENEVGELPPYKKKSDKTNSIWQCYIIGFKWNVHQSKFWPRS